VTRASGKSNQGLPLEASAKPGNEAGCLDTSHQTSSVFPGISRVKIWLNPFENKEFHNQYFIIHTS
jgi:hypothetical protein